MLRPLDFIVSQFQNVDLETVPWYVSLRKQYLDACSGFSEIAQLDSSKGSQVAPISRIGSISLKDIVAMAVFKKEPNKKFTQLHAVVKKAAQENENRKKLIARSSTLLDASKSTKDLEQIKASQLAERFSVEPFWRTDLVLVFPEHHSNFFSRFWKWIRFPLIEKYNEMLEMNQELDRPASLDAAGAKQDSTDTSMHESKSEGRDQKTQAAVGQKSGANSTERGGLENIAYVEPKHRLNVQVKFCPSCQVNVEGRGLTSMDFFPFKLPPLDRRKTDIKQLQNAVTNYLATEYLIDFPKWQQLYRYNNGKQKKLVRLQKRKLICEMEGMQDGSIIYLTEECGFDMKVIHESIEIEGAQNLQVLDDKIYLMLMVKPDVSVAAARHFRMEQQLAMFNEFYPCDTMRQRCFMPFSTQDYAKLAYEICSMEIELSELKSLKLLSSHFAIHNDMEAQAIRNRFMVGSGWLHPFNRIPAWLMNGENYEYPTISSVRVYLGDRLALYFGFMSFYTIFMLPLAIVAVGYTLFQFAFAMNIWFCRFEMNNFTGFELLRCGGDKQDNIGESEMGFGSSLNNWGMVVMSVVVAIWSTLFVEFWKRKQSELLAKWDSLPNDEAMVVLGSQVRTNYRGDEVFDYFDYKLTKEFPKSKCSWGKGMGIVTLMSMLVVIIICFIAIESWKYSFGDEAGSIPQRLLKLSRVLKDENFLPHTNVTTSYIFFSCAPGIPCFFTKAQAQLIMKLLGSTINGVIINLFNIFYGYVARVFTDLENHRYSRDYEEALIYKVFAFQFVNSYFAILWSIFVYRNMESVAIQVLLVTLTKLLMDIFISHIVPLLRRKIGIICRKRVLDADKEQEQLQKLCELPQAYDTDLAARYFTVENLHVMFDNKIKRNFNGFHTVNQEYMKVVIQFGYLVMFSSCFPLFPLVLLIYNWVETKLDIYEYTLTINRAPKEKIRGIGAWMNVLSFLSMVAAILNCFTIVVVSRNLHELSWIIGTHDDVSSVVCFGQPKDEQSPIKYAAGKALDSLLTNNSTWNTSVPAVCSGDCLSTMHNRVDDELVSFANGWCLSGMIAVSLILTMEHFIIALKIILTICIADMPPWVQKAISMTTRLRAKLADEKARSKGDKPSKRIMGNRSRHSRDATMQQEVENAGQMPLRKFPEIFPAE